MNLTHEVHEFVESFADDTRIAELTQAALPDAKTRLEYIVSKTDEAAHRTLNGAEETVATVDTIQQQMQELQQRCRLARGQGEAVNNPAALMAELDDHFDFTGDRLGEVRGQMSAIILAQDYQDITGQIIRQVVDLVGEVETRLKSMLTISKKTCVETADSGSPPADVAVGPQMPDARADKVVKSQGDVDDLLDNLGI